MSNKDLIKKAGFPDYMASDEEKLKDSYGLQYAQAIQYESFFRPEGGSNKPCLFYDKRRKYDMLRKYARGEQDDQIYKNLLTNGEETSFTNYDWRVVQVLPKFVKLLTNQLTERLFEVKADAVDKYSTDLKDNYRQYLEDLMVTRPLREEAKNLLGVNLPEDTSEIPDSQEEIDLHMQLKYKPAIEIATEESIKFTLGLNNYNEIQSRVLEDIAVIGLGAVKHHTDPTKGIRVKYIDPADMVYSYPKDRNFEEVHYYGEVERITIMELKRRTGKRFSDEELRSMGTSSNQWNSYHNITNQFSYNDTDRNLDRVMVDILNFTFKSINTVTFKKTLKESGGFELTPEESSFIKEDEGDYEVLKKNIDVWYEGSLVLGTEHLFNYRLCENMVRPKGYLNDTVPNYVFYAPEIYQNVTRSLVESVIPIIDQMQIIHIKVQQAIAKARPNGVYIDIAGLDEITMGEGNTLTPLELIKLYDETGNVLGSSVGAGGDYNPGKIPIQELRNGGAAGIGDYITTWNHFLNQLRDIIGMPVGTDASTPHPDMAVGVQEQLALNSNTATRHILSGMLNITERMAKGLTYRLRDIFKYSDLKNVYINAIGKINVEVLNSIKNFHLHDLGILISLKPDAQEKQQLEVNINTALTKSEITLDDVIDIREVGNIKLANQLLKIRRAKREKDVRKFEMQKIEANAEAQKNAALTASQAKLSEYQAKAQSEISIENTKIQNELTKLRAEADLKKELMQMEFEFNMQLKGLETSGKQEMLRQQQEGKIALQDRGNTQNSKMIEQRHYNAPSLNFESTNDTLSGGMDLNEVGVT